MQFPFRQPLLQSVIYSILLVLSSLLLHAQPTSSSPLPPADSIKIYALDNKAYALQSVKPDSAFLLANQALKLAEQLNNLEYCYFKKKI